MNNNYRISLALIISFLAHSAATAKREIDPSNLQLGHSALKNLSESSKNNTAIGQQSLMFLEDGNDNVALGKEAGLELKTGSHNIYIKNTGSTKDAKTIRIGEEGRHQKCFIAGINNNGFETQRGEVKVVVINEQGQLGTISLSQVQK